jgi:ribonuclease HI
VSIAKFDALTSKRITEIHASFKLLKGHQNDIKFQWIPSHCGVVDNERADDLAKNGTAISQTFTCKLSPHCAKLKLKRSIQADLSRYHTNQG